MGSYGNLLQSGLMCFYLILVLVFLFERNWVKAMYWAGALIITSSVFLMK